MEGPVVTDDALSIDTESQLLADSTMTSDDTHGEAVTQVKELSDETLECICADLTLIDDW